MNDPIINTMLDQDLYKVTMANMIMHSGHADVQVRYEFKNRHKDRVYLANSIDLDELQEQLDAVRALKFNAEELRYLSTLGYLSDDFLKYLLFNMEMPPIKVWKDAGTKELRISTSGRWIDAIWWEVPVLSIVNELYFRQFVATGLAGEIRNRLGDKISRLRAMPQLNFIEFGTRRRWSRKVQEVVISTLVDEIPMQVAGTSNMEFARRFNLKPMGTMAHELFSGYMGIYGDTNDGLINSQRYVLRDWWDCYRGPLSIALTDTVGTDWFLSNLTEEQAKNWWGMRQDSGDPFEIAEKIIRFYSWRDIDPRRKMLVFSDGLDIDLIERLWEKFSDRIGCGFGWGTNLTNDTGYATPVSMVMKLVEADGNLVVKLSDNPNKSVGFEKEVKRVKKVFDYVGCKAEECKY